MKRLALVLSFALIFSGLALGAQASVQAAVPQVAETAAVTTPPDAPEEQAACPVIQTDLITSLGNCDIPIWAQGTCDTEAEEDCYCTCVATQGTPVRCVGQCCD